LATFPAPPAGDRVRYEDGRLVVPDRPIVPFVEGDGIGPDIWKATRRVLDAAVSEAYGGKRAIVWYEVFAGEKAYEGFGEWLPAATAEAVREFKVAI
jgi:isocitrate dehydrogenase